MNTFLDSKPALALVCFLVSAAPIHASPEEAKISVTSPAFRAGEEIPRRFTCKGANVNPPLHFQNVPKETKSLVLIVDDPDAPGGLFTHWLAWNIDPALHAIGEKSAPAGAGEGTNDFGNLGYGGPCPPSGTHRYFFRVLALDRKLELKRGARRAQLDQALAGHVLARGALMGRCSR